MPEATDAIISIHPGHADAILDGRKTIELRRRIPAIPLGTQLWIYATRPTGAIVGIAEVKKVTKAPPATIWKEHGNGTAVDHASFKAYFEGVQEGVAIVLAAARRVGPITIDQLREVRARFHPPQVLIRLTSSEAKVLKQIAKFKRTTKDFPASVPCVCDPKRRR